MSDPDHYFTSRPRSEARLRRFRARLRGEDFEFVTGSGVFSADRIDTGTKLLVERIDLPEGGVFLDLGAGYGPIGIALARTRPRAHVVMVETNQRAAELAATNIRLNRLPNAEALVGDGLCGLSDGCFDLVATNPPIRAGNAVVAALIAQAAGGLAPGGSLWLVARTRQGAGTIARMMEAHFPRVHLRGRGSGYRVFEGVRHAP
jgi:16S rRNA (guanine1207-N2)-methyltransferase